MKIIATPIILENYIDGVIMRKRVFLNVFRENIDKGKSITNGNDELHYDEFDYEKIIKNSLECGRLLADFGDYVIVDRKFYDISKLVGVYSYIC